MSLKKNEIEVNAADLETDSVSEGGLGSTRSKKAKSQTRKGSVSLSFEEAMEEMEALIVKMQQESLPLESMIESYERGNRLLKICRERLSQAQLRVERIQSGFEPEDDGTIEDFESQSAQETSESPSPIPQNPSLKRKAASQVRSADPTNEDPQDHEFRLL